jgi:hypothetical protein
MLHSYRSAKGEKEDKEALKKDREKLENMESGKHNFGGGKKHSGILGLGAKDSDVQEVKERIKRREKDEAMYERDRYKEHR